MFTRAMVGRDAVLVLAPLSVVPKYQRKGITFGIKPPFDVPDENFMAYKIKEDAPDIHGIVKYATFACGRSGKSESKSANALKPKPNVKNGCDAKIGGCLNEDGKWVLRTLNL